MLGCLLWLPHTTKTRSLLSITFRAVAILLMELAQWFPGLLVLLACSDLGPVKNDPRLLPEGGTNRARPGKCIFAIVWSPTRRSSRGSGPDQRPQAGAGRIAGSRREGIGVRARGPVGGRRRRRPELSLPARPSPRPLGSPTAAGSTHGARATSTRAAAPRTASIVSGGQIGRSHPPSPPPAPRPLRQQRAWKVPSGLVLDSCPSSGPAGCATPTPTSGKTAPDCQTPRKTAACSQCACAAPPPAPLSFLFLVWGERLPGLTPHGLKSWSVRPRSPWIQGLWDREGAGDTFSPSTAQDFHA